VLFIRVDISCRCPAIIASFKVLQDLSVQIFDNAQELDSEQLVYIVGEDKKLSVYIVPTAKHLLTSSECL